MMIMREVMIPCPYHVSSDTSVDEALNIMALRVIRHLPVVDEGALLGIVTERDLRMAQLVTAEVTHPSVGVLCRQDPALVSEKASVADVALEMTEKRLDCVLVSDESGALVGIFTSTDACRLLYMLLDESEQ